MNKEERTIIENNVRQSLKAIVHEIGVGILHRYNDAYDPYQSASSRRDFVDGKTGIAGYYASYDDFDFLIVYCPERSVVDRKTKDGCGEIAYAIRAKLSPDAKFKTLISWLQYQILFPKNSDSNNNLDFHIRCINYDRFIDCDNNELGVSLENKAIPLFDDFDKLLIESMRKIYPAFDDVSVGTKYHYDTTNKRYRRYQPINFERLFRFLEKNKPIDNISGFEYLEHYFKPAFEKTFPSYELKELPYIDKIHDVANRYHDIDNVAEIFDEDHNLIAKICVSYQNQSKDCLNNPLQSYLYPMGSISVEIWDKIDQPIFKTVYVTDESKPHEIARTIPVNKEASMLDEKIKETLAILALSTIELMFNRAYFETNIEPHYYDGYFQEDGEFIMFDEKKDDQAKNSKPANQKDESQQIKQKDSVTEDNYIKMDGEYHEFEGGAIRYTKTGKGKFDLIPWETLKPVSDKIINDLTIDAFITDMDILLALINRDPVDVIINITAVKYGEGIFSADAFAEMLRDLAVHYEKGAEKYGVDNWKKGIPSTSFWDSGCRHACQFVNGFIDEPHWISAIWNMIGYIWTINLNQ